MATIGDVYDYINKRVPFKTAESWDNCGLLIGGKNSNVTKVLIALDVDDAVVAEAVENGAQLIISHHPVIFNPIKKIESHDVIYSLIRHEIAVISAHTNLDIAPYSVNDALAGRLGLGGVKGFHAGQVDFIVQLYLGRIGELEEEIPPREFALHVKKNLNCQGVRYTEGQSPVKRVAVCGGSGGSLLAEVVKLGANAFVTADIKHDVFVEAKHLGITLVDAGHFYTETVILEHFKNMLQNKFTTVKFSIAQSNAAPENYV